MAYQAPHLRRRNAVAPAPAPKAVDVTSTAEFPTLGHVPVTVARTVRETSLAARAAAWNEASKPKVVVDTRKAERALEEAKLALRGFYSVSMRARAPTPYRYQHELEQDRLDELEAEEADELEDTQEAVPEEEQWTTVERGAAREAVRARTPPRQEVDQERIRERITFLNKKLRRNDLQNQNSLTRQAYEKELRELYHMLQEEN
jgi:hypothetical protein